MGQDFNNSTIKHPGAMFCYSGLAESIQQGMACEAEVHEGSVTWKPCGKERARSLAESHVAPIEGSTYRPECCPDCGLDYVGSWDILEFDNDLQQVVLYLVCGNCSWDGEVQMSLDQDHRLSFVQDQQRSQMVEDIKNANRLELYPWVVKFAAALEADAILPEDF